MARPCARQPHFNDALAAAERERGLRVALLPCALFPNGHRYAKYAGQRLKPQAYTDEERVIWSPHALGPCMAGQPGVAARAVGEAAGARAQQLDQGARRQARALPRVGHVGRERVARRRGRLALAELLAG